MTDLEKDILDDLIYLSKRLPLDLQDDEIKQFSTILRKLLLEDSLGNMWRSVGFKKQPRLLCNDIEKLIKQQTHLPQEYIVIAGGLFLYKMKEMAAIHTDH